MSTEFMTKEKKIQKSGTITINCDFRFKWLRYFDSLQALEDQGFFCVDNLPPPLIAKF